MVTLLILLRSFTGFQSSFCMFKCSPYCDLPVFKYARNSAAVSANEDKERGKKLINILYVLFFFVLELVQCATKNNGSQLSARQGGTNKTRISNNKLKIA